MGDPLPQELLGMELLDSKTTWSFAVSCHHKIFKFGNPHNFFNIPYLNSIGLLVARHFCVLYFSGRQPPGRVPVPVRVKFVTGPYAFSE